VPLRDERYFVDQLIAAFIILPSYLSFRHSPDAYRSGYDLSACNVTRHRDRFSSIFSLMDLKPDKSSGMFHSFGKNQCASHGARIRRGSTIADKNHGVASDVSFVWASRNARQQWKKKRGGKEKKRGREKKSQIRVACALICDTYAVSEKRRFGGLGEEGSFRRRTYEEDAHTYTHRERERGPGRESWIKAAAGGGGRDEERRRRNKRVVCWQSFFLQKSPAALHCAGRSWCFAGIFVSDAESAVISGGFLPPPLPTPPHLSFPSRWTVPSSRAVARICFIRRRSSSSSSSSYSNARYKCAKIART